MWKFFWCSGREHSLSKGFSAGLKYSPIIHVLVMCVCVGFGLGGQSSVLCLLESLLLFSLRRFLPLVNLLNLSLST